MILTLTALPCVFLLPLSLFVFPSFSFLHLPSPFSPTQVTLKEDGSGAGGYAKEMSPEWFAAAEAVSAVVVASCCCFRVV